MCNLVKFTVIVIIELMGSVKILRCYENRLWDY